MKRYYRIATLIMLVTLGNIMLSGGQTVTDFDGNEYETITIGDQTWLKENLKSLHYSDGTPIEGVLSYDEDDSLAEIYGRLYNWDAAMYNSTTEGVQGACPEGWHVPSIGEWAALASYLGGDNVAGGKMKEEGTSHWQSPNTGATNESGFTGLPAGEKDNEKFWLLGKAAVMWSSSESSEYYAEYRYLSNDDAKLGYYNYYKSFYYSVRCVKNITTGINKSRFKGFRIYPNPVDQVLNFDNAVEKEEKNKICVTIYSLNGREVEKFDFQNMPHQKNLELLPTGLYFIKIDCGNKTGFAKIVKK